MSPPGHSDLTAIHTFRLTACRVTENNQQTVAAWCNGRIRGIMKLPDYRVVQFNDHNEEEQDASVGEWIVNFNGTRIFIVLKDDQAQLLFHKLSLEQPRG